MGGFSFYANYFICINKSRVIRVYVMTLDSAWKCQKIFTHDLPTSGDRCFGASLRGLLGENGS